MPSARFQLISAFPCWLDTELINTHIVRMSSHPLTIWIAPPSCATEHTCVKTASRMSAETRIPVRLIYYKHTAEDELNKWTAPRPYKLEIMEPLSQQSVARPGTPASVRRACNRLFVL